MLIFSERPAQVWKRVQERPILGRQGASVGEPDYVACAKDVTMYDDAIRRQASRSAWRSGS